MAANTMRLKRAAYWVAPHQYSSTYNLRATTLRELQDKMINAGSDEYSDPIKVEVAYSSALDLINLCLEEGGAHWERR